MIFFFDLVLPDLQLVVTEDGQCLRGGPTWCAVIAIVAVSFISIFVI